MPYPAHIEDILGFKQIRHLLAGYCISEQGRLYIDKLHFITRFDTLEKMLEQTHEFKQLLQSDAPFPAEHYYHIEPYLKKAEVPGMFLQEDEWNQIRLLIQTFSSVCRYIEQRSEVYPQLFALLGGITVNAGISKSIERIVDEQAKLRPDASPELARISSRMSEAEREIRKRINRIFDKAQEKGWLADTGITIRDGRLVLPVLAEHKRNIPGFIHDESSTGQTQFIEPADVFDYNNQLREWQLAYKRERERILTALTDKIRPDLPELYKYMQRLGITDFIRAKALLALRLQAHKPILHKHPGVKWCSARHPMLVLSHEKSNLPVVPMNIEVNRENRIVVISGPNAGGKSVCLKTVGLLQYMLQCGLLVTAEPHSECGIFQELMADIGDEQSIENDLSTYSSHLRHMHYFTAHADGKTLFLIDEFGTGTDPQFGGPLAEAILHQLHTQYAFGVVTTHYSNLKSYASHTKGVLNASMLFDNTQLKPLYILETGKPGSSYAFEIAHKTGLKKEILDYARQKAGVKQKRVDDLLIELEREKQQLTDLKQRFEKKNTEAQQLAEAYNKQKNELDAQRKQLVQEAKREALSIISEANSRIEQTIRELKEKKADTDTIRKVRSELKTETDQLKSALVEQATPEKKVHQLKVQVGDWVKLAGQTQSGVVEELSGKKALVVFDHIKTWVAVTGLERGVAPQAKQLKPGVQGLDVNERLKHFSTELNLIAHRGEDALKEIQLYIDDAYLLGFKQVRIVHGKGYGILRKLIREWLSRSPLVHSYTDEHIELGGDGVTVVQLSQN
ncbi:MAG: endonuclease MutS2 [Bacteroidota bacterium]